MPEPIRVFSSLSDEYEDAFKAFLKHTDQKEKARAWLLNAVRHLPRHGIFIDAGAGTGKVTSWLMSNFKRTIAIEPNQTLIQDLKRSCPSAEIRQEKIADLSFPPTANLILCSHVFYYLQSSTWLSLTEKMSTWLAPGGILVIIIQNSATDCMSMLKHFYGSGFDLSKLASDLKSAGDTRYEITLETVKSFVEAPDADSAFRIAEFMMNLLPSHHPPSAASLKHYVEEKFKNAAAGYRFSCHQDFLTIRRKLTESATALGRATQST